MGRAVAQAAFHRDVRHFAYPFGDRAAFARKHVAMAEEAGFASAASAIPGVVHAEGRTNLHALPRIAWDGRQRSLRVMRVLLSGVAFAPVAPTRSRHWQRPQTQRPRASGRDIQLMIGIAGSTHPMPATT